MNDHSALSKWIQEQLFIYVALSLLEPLEPLDYLNHAQTASSFLLCLTHRLYPESLPDLVHKLSQQHLHHQQHCSIAHRILSSHLLVHPPTHSTLDTKEERLDYLYSVWHAATVNATPATSSRSSESFDTTPGGEDLVTPTSSWSLSTFSSSHSWHTDEKPNTDGTELSKRTLVVTEASDPSVTVPILYPSTCMSVGRDPSLSCMSLCAHLDSVRLMMLDSNVTPLSDLQRALQEVDRLLELLHNHPHRAELDVIRQQHAYLSACLPQLQTWSTHAHRIQGWAIHHIQKLQAYDEHHYGGRQDETALQALLTDIAAFNQNDPGVCQLRRGLQAHHGYWQDRVHLEMAYGPLRMLDRVLFLARRKTHTVRVLRLRNAWEQLHHSAVHHLSHLHAHLTTADTDAHLHSVLTDMPSHKQRVDAAEQAFAKLSGASVSPVPRHLQGRQAALMRLWDEVQRVWSHVQSLHRQREALAYFQNKIETLIVTAKRIKGDIVDAMARDDLGGEEAYSDLVKLFLSQATFVMQDSCARIPYPEHSPHNQTTRSLVQEAISQWRLAQSSLEDMLTCYQQAIRYANAQPLLHHQAHMYKTQLDALKEAIYATEQAFTSEACRLSDADTQSFEGDVRACTSKMNVWRQGELARLDVDTQGWLTASQKNTTYMPILARRRAELQASVDQLWHTADAIDSFLKHCEAKISEAKEYQHQQAAAETEIKEIGQYTSDLWHFFKNTPETERIDEALMAIVPVSSLCQVDTSPPSPLPSRCCVAMHRQDNDGFDFCSQRETYLEHSRCHLKKLMDGSHILARQSTERDLFLKRAQALEQQATDLVEQFNSAVRLRGDMDTADFEAAWHQSIYDYQQGVQRLWAEHYINMKKQSSDFMGEPRDTTMCDVHRALVHTGKQLYDLKTTFALARDAAKTVHHAVIQANLCAETMCNDAKALLSEEPDLLDFASTLPVSDTYAQASNARCHTKKEMFDTSADVLSCLQKVEQHAVSSFPEFIHTSSISEARARLTEANNDLQKAVQRRQWWIQAYNARVQWEQHHADARAIFDRTQHAIAEWCQQKEHYQSSPDHESPDNMLSHQKQGDTLCHTLDAFILDTLRESDRLFATMQTAFANINAEASQMAQVVQRQSGFVSCVKQAKSDAEKQVQEFSYWRSQWRWHHRVSLCQDLHAKQVDQLEAFVNKYQWAREEPLDTTSVVHGRTELDRMAADMENENQTMLSLMDRDFNEITTYIQARHPNASTKDMALQQLACKQTLEGIRQHVTDAYTVLDQRQTVEKLVDKANMLHQSIEECCNQLTNDNAGDMSTPVNAFTQEVNLFGEHIRNKHDGTLPYVWLSTVPSIHKYTNTAIEQALHACHVRLVTAMRHLETEVTALQLQTKQDTLLRTVKSKASDMIQWITDTENTLSQLWRDDTEPAAMIQAKTELENVCTQIASKKTAVDALLSDITGDQETLKYHHAQNHDNAVGCLERIMTTVQHYWDSLTRTADQMRCTLTDVEQMVDFKHRIDEFGSQCMDVQSKLEQDTGDNVQVYIEKGQLAIKDVTRRYHTLYMPSLSSKQSPQYPALVQLYDNATETYHGFVKQLELFMERASENHLKYKYHLQATAQTDSIRKAIQSLQQECSQWDGAPSEAKRLMDEFTSRVECAFAKHRHDMAVLSSLYRQMPCQENDDATQTTHADLQYQWQEYQKEVSDAWHWRDAVLEWSELLETLDGIDSTHLAELKRSIQALDPNHADKESAERHANMILAMLLRVQVAIDNAKNKAQKLNEAFPLDQQNMRFLAHYNEIMASVEESRRTLDQWKTQSQIRALQHEYQRTLDSIIGAIQQEYANVTARLSKTEVWDADPWVTANAIYDQGALLVSEKTCRRLEDRLSKLCTEMDAHEDQRWVDPHDVSKAHEKIALLKQAHSDEFKLCQLATLFADIAQQGEQVHLWLDAFEYTVTRCAKSDWIESAVVCSVQSNLESATENIDNYLKAADGLCQQHEPSSPAVAHILKLTRERADHAKARWQSAFDSVTDLQRKMAWQRVQSEIQDQFSRIEKPLEHSQEELMDLLSDMAASKTGVGSMLREPEVMAMEGQLDRIQQKTVHINEDIAHLDQLLAEHQAESNYETQRIGITKHLEAVHSLIDSARQWVVEARLSGRHLLIADDIQLLLTGLETAIEQANTDISNKRRTKTVLEELETYYRCYRDNVLENLEAADHLDHDNAHIHEHFALLRDRWFAVEQQAQMRIAELRQAIQQQPVRPQRLRIASLPTLRGTVLMQQQQQQLQQHLQQQQQQQHLLSSSSSPLIPKPTTSRALPLVPERVTQRRPSTKCYVPDPKNGLDVAIADTVNALGYNIKVEMVPGQVGRYWFGQAYPRLVYCRILKSGLVMVRVGGGWTELSQFLRNHCLLEVDFVPRTASGDDELGYPFQQSYIQTARCVGPTVRPSVRRRSSSFLSLSSSRSMVSTGPSLPPIGQLEDLISFRSDYLVESPQTTSISEKSSY